MTVVVDLDARRRLVQAQPVRQILEQRRLCRGVGEPQRQRLPGVGDGVLDQLLLLASLRHRDLDPAAGPHRQRLRQQRLLGQRLGQEQERRRLPLAVELGDERLNDLGQLAVPRVRGIVGAVAVVAPTPIEEDLDADLPAGTVGRDHVGVLDGRGVDALAALDVRQRLQAVAQHGRRLELQPVRGRRHLRLELLLDLARPPGQEGPHLGHETGIVGPLDAADAGGRAALDLVLQAGPAAALEDAVGAAPERKGAEQRVERLVDRSGRGERAEDIRAPRA